MAKKKYLVVHPKLSVLTEGGYAALLKGAEISMDEKEVGTLVESGKLQLVVAKKPEKKLTNASKSKRQRSKRDTSK
jgi:hypothetical protein